MISTLDQLFAELSDPATTAEREIEILDQTSEILRITQTYLGSDDA